MTLKAFKRVSQRINRIGKAVDRDGLSTVIEYLATLGQETIENMYAEKGTNDDLYNQRDAYGFGVYYNGKLVKEGYLEGEKSTAPSRDRKLRGRREAKKAIKNYTPDRQGYVLYLVNAMHYSAVHQKRHKQIIVSRCLYAAKQEIEDKYNVPVTVDFTDGTN